MSHQSEDDIDQQIRLNEIHMEISRDAATELLKSSCRAVCNDGTIESHLCESPIYIVGHAMLSLLHRSLLGIDDSLKVIKDYQAMNVESIDSMSESIDYAAGVLSNTGDSVSGIKPTAKESRIIYEALKSDFSKEFSGNPIPSVEEWRAAMQRIRYLAGGIYHE